MTKPLTEKEARELTDRLRAVTSSREYLLGITQGVAANTLRQPSLYTYFIQVEDPNQHAGPIKIGCARDVRARLSQLQTSSPYDLWLIGYVPGGEKLERELHKKYAHLHLRGEWFRATEDLERDLYFMVYDYEESLR